ncbi:MAG: hypothetical protein MUD13_07455, partial [Candidatus Nanopelagicales bacterium]|nr:hypothetical protein [Candidatus Nanopelagicales bacterium]
KLVLLDVAPERVEALVDALAGLGLQVRPTGIRHATMACTGIEFCKLAIVNTKDTARTLIEAIEVRRPELATPLAVHVNGCPNSCARFQVADIGLKGMLVPDAAPGRRSRGSRCTSEARWATTPGSAASCAPSR